MRKPKKPPVRSKAQGGGKGGPAPGSGGKRGVGPGKKRGIHVHHKGIVPHHPVRHGHRGGGLKGHRHVPGQGGAPAPKKKPQKRGWSPSADVDCCVAEALAVFGVPFEQNAPVSIADALDATQPPHQPGLILGVSLPGPHAIAVTPDGTWWSWGEPFNPDDWPGMVIEEVWCLCGG